MPHRWSGRSFLGLAPHVLRRKPGMAAQLPLSWNTLILIEMALRCGNREIEAEGETVTAQGLPCGWRLITP